MALEARLRQPPWSWRPGVSSVRSAISSRRPARSASTRPRSRPTTATSAPSPRPSRGSRGASRKSSATRAVSATGQGSGSTLQTLSSQAAKTAGPRPVSHELGVEVLFEPLEIGLQADLDLVCEARPTCPGGLRSGVEQRAHACGRVARGRRDARIEIGEADPRTRARRGSLASRRPLRLTVVVISSFLPGRGRF